MATLAGGTISVVSSVALGADPMAVSTWFFGVVDSLISRIQADHAIASQSGQRFLRRHAALSGHAGVDVVPGRLDTGALRARLHITGPVAFKTAIHAGHDTDYATRSMASQMSGVSGEFVWSGDRDVIHQSALHGHGVVGWRRVLVGRNCGFCAMLASRGAVYVSEASATTAKDGMAYHGHCNCAALPIYKGQQEPQSVRELQRQWRQVTAGRHGDDAARAWQRYWDKVEPRPSRSMAFRPATQVREALAQAQDPQAVAAAFRTEFRRITGRDVDAQFAGSVATAREHAEGLLRTVERYPETPLTRVQTGPLPFARYAESERGVVTFSEHWSSVEGRPRYLAALRADERRGWHPYSTPDGIASHEVVHILDPDAPIESLVGRRTLPGYSARSEHEALAEAVADVMVNGPNASALSREITGAVDDAYAAGRIVGRRPRLARPGPPSRLSPPARGGPQARAAEAELNRLTVPQLKAMARERGIPGYTAMRKQELVDALGGSAPVKAAKAAAKKAAPKAAKAPAVKAAPVKKAPAKKAPAPKPLQAASDAVAAARTVDDVGRALAQGIGVENVSLAGIRDLATAREFAQGLLTAMERFPQVTLRGLRAARVDGYAHTTRAGLIEFNAGQLSGRRALLERLQRRVDSGWFTPASGTPAGISLHEFGHALAYSLGDYDETVAAVRRALEALARRRGLRSDYGLGLADEVSKYARTNPGELIGESFADVMLRGSEASEVAQVVFGALERRYAAKFGVRKAAKAPAVKAAPVKKAPAKKAPAPKPPAQGADLIDRDGLDKYAAWLQRRRDELGAAGRADNFIQGRAFSIRAVAERQGFDRPPVVVSAEEMDRLIADGATPFYRGLAEGIDAGGTPRNGAYWADQFRTGDPHWAAGTNGSGVYFIESRQAAGAYADSWDGVLRAVLRPDAKVIERQEVKRLIAEAKARAAKAGVDFPEFLEDEGVFAASLGYDAMTARARSGLTTIILNRSAVIVEGSPEQIAKSLALRTAKVAKKAAPKATVPKKAPAPKPLPTPERMTGPALRTELEAAGLDLPAKVAKPDLQRWVVAVRSDRDAALTQIRREVAKATGRPSSTAPSLKAIFDNPDRAAAQRAIREGVEGTYGGLRVETTLTEVEPGRIRINGQVFDSGGRQVGEFSRAVFVDTDGRLVALHAELRLDRRVQGSGFAETFNGNLMDWYRRSGIDEVRLIANVDVGGYAWAARGFDFYDARTASKFLEDAGDKLAQALAKFERTGRLPKGITEDDLRALGAYVDDMVRGRRPAHAPDIARFGRKPGQKGKAATWAGKWLMLGSSWSGRLLL